MTDSDENTNKPLRWTNTVKINKYVQQKPPTKIQAQRQEIPQAPYRGPTEKKCLIFQRIFSEKKGRHLSSWVLKF